MLDCEILEAYPLLTLDLEAAILHIVSPVQQQPNAFRRSGMQQLRDQVDPLVEMRRDALCIAVLDALALLLRRLLLLLPALNLRRTPPPLPQLGDLAVQFGLRLRLAVVTATEWCTAVALAAARGQDEHFAGRPLRKHTRVVDRVEADEVLLEDRSRSLQVG